MKVLFHKHVWLYSEYMPTLYWWIGASSVSPYVITVAWWMPSDIIIHHWSIAYDLISYWSFPSYFSVAIVTIGTKLLLLFLPLLPLLPYYFATKYFATDFKSFRCGWIDNSATNTWEYSFASPWVESINLGWILYLENCCDPLHLWVIKTIFWRRCRGSTAIFSESLGIYVCWSLWGIR